MTKRNIKRAFQSLCPNQHLPAHGNIQVLVRAVYSAAAAGVALAVLSGCTAQANARSGELLAARKAESLKGWETATLAGRSLLESPQGRVALLITNFDSVTVEIKDSKLSVQGDRSAQGGIGSAIPISNDGYFLTAAHVIDNADSLHLLVGLAEAHGRTRAEGIPARVVWKSQVAFFRPEDWSPGEPLSAEDIAIIHAEVGSLPSTVPFTLSEEAPQNGDLVIIAGWSLINVADLPQGARFAAGKIVSVVARDALGASPAFMTVHHDAPVAGGDSGGPLLDHSGKLVGITSVSPLDMGDIATATMPDQNWLWEAIDNDRQKRNARPALHSRRESKFQIGLP